MTAKQQSVLSRLERAMNQRDVDGLLACFDAEYHSQQPVYPDREFQGKPKIRENWSKIFEEVSEFQAEILRSVADGDTVWTEWHWNDPSEEGSDFEMRGMTIFGVQNERITWGRLYMEPVGTNAVPSKSR